MFRAANPFEFGSRTPEQLNLLASEFRHRLTASDLFVQGALSDPVGGEEFACGQTSRSWQSLVSSTVSRLLDCGLGILALVFVLSILSARKFSFRLPVRSTPYLRRISPAVQLWERGFKGRLNRLQGR